MFAGEERYSIIIIIIVIIIITGDVIITVFKLNNDRNYNIASHCLFLWSSVASDVSSFVRTL